MRYGFYLDTGIRSSAHLRGIREFVTATREIRELCKFRVKLINCYEFLRICRKVRGPAEALGQVVTLGQVP